MGKFGRLKQLDITGKTHAFELPEAHVPEFCEDAPVLELAHMGRANAEYFNARMVIAANDMARSGKKRSQKELEEEAVKQAIDLSVDRELIPAYVITGWSNLYDDKGNEVSFSTQDAADLVAQLPDDVIDRMRAAAMNITNYRDTPVLTAAGEEALEGN